MSHGNPLCIYTNNWLILFTRHKMKIIQLYKCSNYSIKIIIVFFFFFVVTRAEWFNHRIQFAIQLCCLVSSSVWCPLYCWASMAVSLAPMYTLRWVSIIFVLWEARIFLINTLYINISHCLFVVHYRACGLFLIFYFRVYLVN